MTTPAFPPPSIMDARLYLSRLLPPKASAYEQKQQLPSLLTKEMFPHRDSNPGRSGEGRVS